VGTISEVKNVSSGPTPENARRISSSLGDWGGTGEANTTQRTLRVGKITLGNRLKRVTRKQEVRERNISNRLFEPFHGPFCTMALTADETNSRDAVMDKKELQKRGSVV
jgi:hypothetical protein